MPRWKPARHLLKPHVKRLCLLVGKVLNPRVTDWAGLHSVWLPYCKQQKPCLRPSSVQWNPVLDQTTAPPGRPAQDFNYLQHTNIGSVDAKAFGSALLLGLVSLETALGTQQDLLIPSTMMRPSRQRCWMEPSDRKLLQAASRASSNTLQLQEHLQRVHCSAPISGIAVHIRSLLVGDVNQHSVMAVDLG